jgi:type I restriction enzyme M protein
VTVQCISEEEGKMRSRKRTVSLAVYQEKGREVADIIRVAIVVKLGTKGDAKAIGVLDEVLGNLSQDRDKVFGLWTNGSELAFRMRTFHKRTGEPEFTDLTDIPAPDETLEELESADRRPLRIASGDSLLRTFISALWAPRVRRVARAERLAAKTLAFGTPVASANQSNMGGQLM